MATQDKSVHFFNQSRNVVLNQSPVTVVDQSTNISADPHAALRYLYDASARYAGTGHPDAASTCLEGTRKTALQDIDTWKEKQLAPASTSEMLWVTGSAGTGKSAIAQTTCERFEEAGIQVVHCFLSNSSGRTHPAYVFLTIAYQLATKVTALKAPIEAVVQADPSVVDAPIDKQLRRLILNPITNAADPLPTIFVVVDGLDECKGEQTQVQIISLIQTVIQGPPLPLRFLLASRSELWIRNTLLSSSAPPIAMITLDQNNETDNDIRFFYVSEFKKIREHLEHQDSMHGAPVPWPSDVQLSELVARASGQFIYAKTVTRFVGEAGYHPVNRLDSILSPTSHLISTPLGQLDSLYTRILSSVPDWSLTRITLGCLTAVGQPGFPPNREALSIIEALLGLIPGDAYRALRNLHALVFIPKDLSSNRETLPAQDYERLLVDESQHPHFLHKSFTDFLSDPQRAGTFFVEQKEADRKLSLGCLRTLQNAASTLPTSLVPTRLFTVTWYYAHCRWEVHCIASGTQGNQNLMMTLDQFSMSSHYFLRWKLDRPDVWKKMAPLRLLERWDDKAFDVIKRTQDVCTSLGLSKNQAYLVEDMYNWIKSQTDISKLAFMKLRLKIRFLYEIRKDLEP